MKPLRYTQALTGLWENIDLETHKILKEEELRQSRKLILSAALSICPAPVREAMGSVFCNIDAEGHLPNWIEKETLDSLYDINRQIVLYEQLSDNRPNKNTEYANIIEKIAKIRLAGLFKTDKHSENDIYVNLQPPTGAIANTIALEALLEPGDTILSMSLGAGGHLSHGSQFHYSSKKFRVSNYDVDPLTKRLNYKAISEIAYEVQPKLIIAGASSYPWQIDWSEFRYICDNTESRPYLMADIAHTAGLVVGEVFPNPIDYADVTTLVTYKTFCGPRAAAIMTTNKGYSQKINRKLFPEMMGSPIFQNIVALAVSTKISEHSEFKALQYQIVSNARQIACLLQSKGIEVAFGGTETHIVMIDIKRSQGLDPQLNGEIAAKLLEKCNIICNKNMLPGDENASKATGLRIGTTWISQLGVTDDAIHIIVNTIVGILKSIRVEVRDDGKLQGSIPADSYCQSITAVSRIVGMLCR